MTILVLNHQQPMTQTEAATSCIPPTMVAVAAQASQQAPVLVAGHQR